MNQPNFAAENQFATHGYSVADAPVDARKAFIRKTYLHLGAAAYLFVALEYLYFTVLPLDTWFGGVQDLRMPMLIALVAFMVVSWIANRMAHSETSIGMQYAGLSLYVFAESLIFIPLLWIANHYSFQIAGQQMNVLPAAGIITLLLFGGLTAIVFTTRQDFSFLGTGLRFAGFAAIALIFASFFIGFNLGVWFSVAMILFACGYILYDTSNVLMHYRTEQHVAASLALFASLALLLWYVIRLLMAFSSRD